MITTPTPVRDGWRAVWRQPAVFLAELSWRWSWGGAAIILTALASFEYLNTLIVTPGDLILLRLRHPLAVSRALGDIFHGSGPRVVRGAVILVPALAILWILMGAFGRFATLRALVAGNTPDWSARRGSIRALMGVHGLRVALALAGLVSLVGATLIAAVINTPKAPHPALSLLVFVSLVVLILFVWSTINWFLSIAALFVVRDGEDTFGAIAETVAFCRRRGGRIYGAGLWFGLMHLVAFVVGTTVIAYPLAIASIVPAWFTLALMSVVALLYCATADWIYIARLAAYLSLSNWDRSEMLNEAVALSPPNLSGPGSEFIAPDLNFDDEPLFSSRLAGGTDRDGDEPVLRGFSPGEPLPGR